MTLQESARPMVRRAGRSDIGSLVDLMREFYAESEYPLDQRWAEDAFSRLIDDPALGCVWLAQTGSDAAGHVVLTLRYTMEHGSLSGHVDDLFVRPRFRREGVARALMSELFAECRRRGCASVYVEVGDRNDPALALYGEFGLARFQDGRVLLAGAIR